MIAGSWVVRPEAGLRAASPTPPMELVTNTHALGRVLYTDYVFLFQAAGMVLLVAMVGAIVLTLRRREGVKRQRVKDQLGRIRAEAVELKKVQPGEGV